MMLYKKSAGRQNLRAAHKAGEGVQLVCSSRLPTSPWGEAIERAAGNFDN